jgi:serine carboxypeptidase-like clade I
MNNDVYISGESYAGIYVPKLAEQLDAYLVANKDDPTKYKPKFKGFMVGNGVTNWKYDTQPALIEMAYWHGLYDDQLYQDFKTNGCDFSYFEFDYTHLSDACNKLLDRFNSLIENINVYDVFGKCYKSDTFFRLHGASEFGLLKSDSGIKAYKKYFTAADYTPFSVPKKLHNDKHLKVIPPCVYAKPFIGYLNNQTIRDQLHIDKSAPTWDICNDVNYTTNRAGSIDIYGKLKGKYRMLKYSGDADGSVPTIGTRNWIRDLNWAVTEEWRPYFIIDEAGN